MPRTSQLGKATRIIGQSNQAGLGSLRTTRSRILGIDNNCNRHQSQQPQAEPIAHISRSIIPETTDEDTHSSFDQPSYVRDQRHQDIHNDATKGSSQSTTSLKPEPTTPPNEREDLILPSSLLKDVGPHTTKNPFRNSVPSSRGNDGYSADKTSFSEMSISSAGPNTPRARSKVLSLQKMFESPECRPRPHTLF